MAVTRSNQKRLSPRFALGLLLCAALAWAGSLYWQSRNSPAWGHIQAGYALARQGEAIRAVQEWRTATQLDSDNAYAWELIGQSHLSVQQWAQAEEAFQQIRRIDPDWPRVYSSLATCALHLGDMGTALTFAQEELKRNPDDTPALEACAAAQAARGNQKEQIRCLRRLTELQPNKAEHFSALTQALLARRDMAEARSIADRWVQLAPDNADAYLQRGLAIFYADGSPQGLTQAESDLLRSLSLRPKSYPCHLFLAKIYRRKGQWESAATHLKQAMRLDANNPDAYLDLADVYERTGQTAQAAALRQKFRALVEKAESAASTRTGGP